MMKITTQDGRILLLKDRDEVEFRAELFVGHVNRGVVSARIRPSGFDKLVEYRVTLGEYATPENDPWAEARLAAKAVRDAFENGKSEHVMLGNKIVAHEDDLMASIAALDVLLAKRANKGWVLNFGMINGESNSAYDINPDADGSYAAAVKARYDAENNGGAAA